MFLVQRPTPALIDRFIEASRHLPLTYTPVGLARHDGARGYDVDETIAVLGSGRGAFERARAALAAGMHFDLGWVEVFPHRAPIATGTNVAVLIQHVGFWSLNGARVVYQLEASDTRFGFAYGTLPNHAEQGEEVFEVAFDADSGDVTYRLRAVSRPRAVLARLGYPVARALQARFRRHSARAMTRAAHDPVGNASSRSNP
jgi:uncharacterized protein (UPF0548 family)